MNINFGAIKGTFGVIREILDWYEASSRSKKRYFKTVIAVLLAGAAIKYHNHEMDICHNNGNRRVDSVTTVFVKKLDDCNTKSSDFVFKTNATLNAMIKRQDSLAFEQRKFEFEQIKKRND